MGFLLDFCFSSISVSGVDDKRKGKLLSLWCLWRQTNFLFSALGVHGFAVPFYSQCWAEAAACCFTQLPTLPWSQDSKIPEATTGALELNLLWNPRQSVASCHSPGRAVPWVLSGKALWAVLGKQRKGDLKASLTPSRFAGVWLSTLVVILILKTPWL